MRLEDMYMDVVSYAKELENILLAHPNIDESFIYELRMKFIKPATNVAKEWIEGGKK